MGDWSFLSNHGLALLCIARDPDMRIRDIGDSIGIKERAAHRIVSELVEAGYVKRERQGNRNRYKVRPDVPMRHPLVQEHWIGEILAVLADTPLRVADPQVRRDGQPERRRGQRRQLESETATRER